LLDLMGLNPNRIFSRYDPTKDVDIVIIVGTDWANKAPTP